MPNLIRDAGAGPPQAAGRSPSRRRRTAGAALRPLGAVPSERTFPGGCPDTHCPGTRWRAASRAPWTAGLGVFLLAIVPLAVQADATPLQAWLTESAAVYLPMDDTPAGPCVWHGRAVCEPMPFERPSPAWQAGSGLVPPDHPRLVPGRSGTAVLFEGGHYQWEDRGTTNWLSPEAADPETPLAWQALGGAVLSAVQPGLAGAAALRVTGSGPDDGARTAVRLRHGKVPHIASVHVRSAAAPMAIRVQVRRGEWQAAGEPVATSQDWQIAFCRFEPPTEEGGEDLVIAVSATESGTFELDAAMVEQANKFYHNRQSPSTWVPGRAHRYLDRCVLPAWPETFNPSAGTVMLWVRPLGQQANGTLFAVGAGWTVPLRLELDAKGAATAVLGACRLAFGQCPPTAWTHLALTWEDGQCGAYRDGRLIGSGTYDPAVWPDDLVAAGWQVGIGTDDLGHFARSTGANAALDEVLICRAPMPPALIAAAWTAPGQAAAGWGPAVDLSAMRRAYGREERGVALGVRPVAGAAVSLRLGDRDLDPFSPFEPGAWETGLHRLEVAATDGPAVARSWRAIWIGPAKQWDRFQVIGWNVPAARLGAFAAAGGTVSDSSPSDLAAVRHHRHGLFGMWLYHNLGGDSPAAGPEQRVIGPEGTPGRVNLFHPGVREAALEWARTAAATTRRHPHLRLVLLNTEAALPMDFGSAAAREAHAATGIDFSWWPLADRVLRTYSPQEIEAAEAGLPEPSSGPRPPALRPFNLFYSRFLPAHHQPTGAAIAGDNPLYRFTQWWYTQRSLAAWNEDLAAVFRALNPGVAPLFDPILRGPSLRWYRSMALAQEWVYYEDPLAMVPVQEALEAVCRGLPMRPTGMPQFLFKAGTAAPISVTPPHDLVLTASWLACSRPIEAMTYWGWQVVYGPGDMWTPEHAASAFAGQTWDEAVAKLKADHPKTAPHLWHPGAQEAFAALCRDLYQPFGDLIRAWSNRPRRLAVVKSLAAELWSDERWWTAHRFGPRAMAITALGVPYDVLYDEDLTPETIARYAAIILPAVDVLPQPALEALRHAAGTPLLLGEPVLAAALPRLLPVPTWDADTLRRLLRTGGAESVLDLLPEGGDAVVNALVCDEAAFLVAVNTRRVFGPLVGQWGKVREQGVPQTVKVRLPSPSGAYGAVYELTEGRPVDVGADGSIALDLPGAGGRILAAYPEPLGGVEVGATVERDEDRTMALRLELRAASAAGMPWPHPVPVDLQITRPDGKRDEHGRGVLLRQGHLALRIPLPAALPTGGWQVTVTDRLTRSTTTIVTAAP